MKWNFKEIILKVVLGAAAIVFLGAPSCSWQNYPHLWQTPSYKPWLVLKCQFPDKPDIPQGLDDTINRFFTIAGVGTGNLLDYFSDVSYGAVSFVGSRVYGWYPSGYTTTQLTGPGNRYKQVEACASSIPAAVAANIHFSEYYGIVIVTNQHREFGACYDGQRALTISGRVYRNLACVVEDPTGLDIALAAHEIGHGLGLPHSFSEDAIARGYGCGGSKTPGEYCDKWDMMSSLNAFHFKESNFVTSQGGNDAGPDFSAPNLLALGWIPRVRIATYNIGEPARAFPLAALSHPDAFGFPLVVEIPLGQTVVTVEYRQKDGWDAGIPQSAVVIHAWDTSLTLPVNPSGEPMAVVLNGQGQGPNVGDLSGALLTGQTFVPFIGPFRPSYQIKADSIDEGSGTALVTIGPYTGP